MDAELQPVALLNECDEDVAVAMCEAAERADAMRSRHEEEGKERMSLSTTAQVPSTPGPASIDPEELALAFRRSRDVALLESAKARNARSRAGVDLRIVQLLLEPGRLRKTLARWYHNARMFAVHHVWGRVDVDTEAQRAKACQDCTFRTSEPTGRGHRADFCRAENGGRGCGCPKHWAWPLGRLDYKRNLSNWQCPIGKFGKPKGWFRLRWLGVYALLVGSVLVVIFG